LGFYQTRFNEAVQTFLAVDHDNIGPSLRSGLSLLKTPVLSFKFIKRLSMIDANSWNAVSGKDYPFTRYEFLKAFEDSGAVGGDSGWVINHLLVYSSEDLVAVMPNYLKHHSYGEYVFDHAWADAYQRHGLQYYPKLLSTIPFSPLTGPRLCVSAGQDKRYIQQAIVDFMTQHCEKKKISSWHILFPNESDSNNFEDKLLKRRAVHFQWFNRDYQHFDNFLDTFSSRKRKNLRKERKLVEEQGIQLEVFEGDSIPDSIWERFYYFYQMTYAKRSGHGGYLCKSFFQTLAKEMPESIVLVLAKHGSEYIAGALNFRDSNTLYGRYWGCLKEFKHLHFECCYYQGIEYCIKNKLERFDPGVQGEHKIQRGFRPVFTYSSHFINDVNFRHAIAGFLEQEDQMIQEYQLDTCKYLPFKSVKQDS